MKCNKASKPQHQQSELFRSNCAITNYLVANIQHKRNSCDPKTFLQIYTKKSRAVSIQKEFQTSMNKLNYPDSYLRKGFKGSQIFGLNNISQLLNQNNERSSTSKFRKFSIRTESSNFQSNNELRDKAQNYQATKYRTVNSAFPLSQLQILPKQLINRKTNIKPNLMYNLSLYKNSKKEKRNKNMKNQNKTNKVILDSNSLHHTRQKFLIQHIF